MAEKPHIGLSFRARPVPDTATNSLQPLLTMATISDVSYLKTKYAGEELCSPVNLHPTTQ